MNGHGHGGLSGFLSRLTAPKAIGQFVPSIFRVLPAMKVGGPVIPPPLAPVKDRVPPATTSEGISVRLRRDRLNARPWGDLRGAIAKVMEGIRTHMRMDPYVGNDGKTYQSVTVDSPVPGEESVPGFFSKKGMQYWGERIYALLEHFGTWEKAVIFDEVDEGYDVFSTLKRVYQKRGDPGVVEVKDRLVRTAPEFGFDPRVLWLEQANRAIKSQQDVIAGVIGLSDEIPMSRIRHSLASWVKIRAAIASAGNIDELIRNLRGLRDLESDAQHEVDVRLIVCELLAAE